MTRRFRSAAIVALLAWSVPAEAQTQIRARVYAAGFSLPLAFVQDPTDRTVQYVVEQDGRIRVVQNGSLLSADFLNLKNAISSGGERGLLGLAFAPDYASSGRFYVDFDGDGLTDVAVFRASTGTWYIRASTGTTNLAVLWGGGSDIPILKRP